MRAGATGVPALHAATAVPAAGSPRTSSAAVTCGVPTMARAGEPAGMERGVAVTVSEGLLSVRRAAARVSWVGGEDWGGRTFALGGGGGQAARVLPFGAGVAVALQDQLVGVLRLGVDAEGAELLGVLGFW